MPNMDDDDEVPQAVSLDCVSQAPPVQVPEVSLDAVQSVPVTLITGFLGAGKTTLVHHVLKANHNHRIAVIVNEFGDTSGIESAMVKTAKDDVVVPAEEWVELANGCLCCSVKSDFVAALEGLMLKRDKFDYILIETTGLADPGPVAEALWTDEELEAAVHLDAIITVVDAKHIQQQLQQESSDDSANEAQKQIAYADSVLLNKVDLLPSEQAIKSVESDIHAHNSEVSIMRTTHCSLDIAQILNKGAFAGSRQTPSKLQQLQNLDASRSSVQQQSADALAATAAATYTQSTVTDDNHTEADAAMHSRSDSHSTHYPGPQSQHDDVQVRSQEAQAASSHQHSSDTGHDRSHSHSHDHSHDHAGHLKSVRSISLVQQGAVDLFRLRDWLDQVLWEKASHKQDIYRMKGLLNVADKHEAHILQAVHELYDIVPGMCWSDLPETQWHQTKVVVIGRNLQYDMLHEGFMACFLPEPSQ